MKKTVLTIVMAILGNIFFSANAQATQNVLFIAIDDLRAIGTLFQDEKDDFLALVYPDPELRREVAKRMAPNLQRLADQGVNFMSAYTPSPACNPSRAALMTGVRPHVTRIASNAGNAFFRDWEYEGERPLENIVTMPELLKNNGWYTASTGKIFHRETFDSQDGNRSWTHRANVGGSPQGDIVLSKWSPQNMQTEARRVRWGQRGHDHETYETKNDYQTADFIARLLETGEGTTGGVTYKIPEDSPFFIALGIFRPHLPFWSTKDLLDLFPKEEMTITYELLDHYIQDGADIPLEAQWYGGGFGMGEDGQVEMSRSRFRGVLRRGLEVQPDGGDLKAWKSMARHYFAVTALADRAVGRVLDALEASPYSDNTMVILWSDHGYHLGEKLHTCKFTLWNQASRMPFMIKDPRFPQSAGMNCYTPVSLMDIYPTVAAMAGLELPDHRITGSDLTPLLRDPTLGREQPALVTYGREGTYDHMVRKGRYKLIYSPRDQETHLQLYDVANDPQDYRNLAVLPEYAEIKAMMKEVLYETLESGYGNP